MASHLPNDWSGLALERPTFKHVAASYGDLVRVDSSGIWVNDDLLDTSKALEEDSRGRPMPYFSLKETLLKKGEFLVISHAKSNGLDSRYYGILKDESLVSRVVPVFHF